VHEHLQRRQLDAKEVVELHGESLALLEQQERRHLLEMKIRDPEVNLSLFMRKEGRAKERLAESLGVTVSALSKAAYRARKKLRERGDVEPDEKMKQFGMELTEEFRERLVTARKGMIKVTTALGAAKRAFDALKQAKLDLPSARLERLAAMLDETVSYSRASTPVGLCPYCKGLPALCNDCLSCAGSAMLMKNQEQAVMPELKDCENPLVYHEGEFKPIAAFANGGSSADVTLVEKPPEEPVEEYAEGQNPWGLND
jgi:hypothetical protein